MALADRMGCLKGAVVANVVVPSPDYVRFASHYRFRPDFCQAADTESKRMVENLVGYPKSDRMTPLAALEQLLGTENLAPDWVLVNTRGEQWCATVIVGGLAPWVPTDVWCGCGVDPKRGVELSMGAPAYSACSPPPCKRSERCGRNSMSSTSASGQWR